MKNLTELTPLTVDALTGTSAPTVKKILDIGITTVEDLSRENPKTLSKATGMGEDTAERAITTALRIVSKGYVSGTERYEAIKNRKKLTTGSLALDELLRSEDDKKENKRGGVEENTTLEIAGKNGSGKTQLCHMLAVNVQLPIEEGGLGGEAAWIDTEGTFRPERILEICEHRGLDGSKFLEGISYGEAYHAGHQKILIDQLSEQCVEHNIKLVIVDSMMAHLRGEYIGRGMLSGRQDLLKTMLLSLGKIAEIHNLTVVYTNQVMDDPAAFFQKAAGKAIGGNVMGHAATTRMEIRKGRLEKRIVALTKSPYIKEGEAIIRITERGVEDVEGYESTED